MTLSRVTKLYGVADAKIFPLTTDDITTLAYGAAIDVPGIQSIKLTPNYEDKELKGDDAVLEADTKLLSIDFSFQHAKLSLDALAVLEGGTVTDSGVSPNQKTTYTQTTASKPQYFKFEGQIRYVDQAAGDVHLVLYKAKAGKVDIEVKGDDYVIASASGKAIGTINNGKVKDFVINETEVAIA